jgi:rsbT co-antagonist protein RsbR
VSDFASHDSSLPMSLAQRLFGMERSAIPVWVIDTDSMRILWANDDAARLWNARDVADLLTRDLSGAPAPVIARTQDIAARLRKGETLIEEWTLYPRGVPTTVRLHLSGVPLDDGRIGMLNQALPSGVAQDPTLLRGIESLRHTSVMVALVTESGEILMQNPAALAVFGSDKSWLAWFVDAEAARAMLALALAGQEVHKELMVRTENGERCYAVGAHATRDPVTGTQVVLTHHTDETVRTSAVRTVEQQGHLIEKLHLTLGLVERQRAQILALSVPILDVGERTIAVPIIGQLDESRCAELADRLLGKIVERGAKTVILDLTGAVTLDEKSAGNLMRILQALRLLGSHPILSGIRPEVAVHLVSSGFDISELRLARTLAEALSVTRRPAR